MTSNIGSGRGIRLTMTVPNAKPVDVAISRWGNLITDFTPFWREHVAPAFFDGIQDNFKAEGGRVGGWAALSPLYAKWKQRHYPGKPLMRRTDRLFKSLTFDGGRVGPEGIAHFTKTDAELGTAVPYALVHQWGSARRHLPARRLLFLFSSETAGRMLHRFAVGTLKQAGLGKPAA